VPKESVCDKSIETRCYDARRLCAAILAVGMLVCAGSLAKVVNAASFGTLPDGRAWEMVSPLEKSGGDVRGIDGDSEGGVVEASQDGNSITYVSLASFGEAQGAAIGSQYVSDRDPEGGWLTQNISLPMNAQTYGFASVGTPYDAFSSDLSSGLVLGAERGEYGGHHYPAEGPPLAGAPAGYQNIYLREISVLTGSAAPHLEALLTRVPTEPPEAFLFNFLGATPDLSHVVVSSGAALAPGTVEMAGKENLYEWERATGQFQPVNILPNGTPEPEQQISLGSTNGAKDHAISDSGSDVVWEGRAEGAKDLYVREDIGTQQARTVQADAAVGGEGQFWTASSDGSKIFFTKGDLFMYDVGTGQTTDLAPGVAVSGVVGTSNDGSYVYYVDTSYNLWVWHEGMTSLIAALANGDSSDWAPRVSLHTTRVTPDGTHVLFISERSLTGYDNTVSAGSNCGTNVEGNQLSAACDEIFLYDATSGRISCVSCNPTGARPTGSSNIPGGTDFRLLNALYQSHVLSEDGSRVFFDSHDALVPQDTNGREDVYEYEGGHIYLLSDGGSAGGASFVDASANGDDVFFITRAQLVGQDTDQLVDLYDARAPHVPGEVVGSPVLPPPATCEGETCRPPALSAPAFASPSTATLAGLGNVSPTAAPTMKHTPRKITKKTKLKGRRKAKHGKRAKAGKASGVSRRERRS
jgi:hypothetical protein